MVLLLACCVRSAAPMVSATSERNSWPSLADAREAAAWAAVSWAMAAEFSLRIACCVVVAIVAIVCNATVGSPIPGHSVDSPPSPRFQPSRSSAVCQLSSAEAGADARRTAGFCANACRSFTAKALTLTICASNVGRSRS